MSGESGLPGDVEEWRYFSGTDRSDDFASVPEALALAIQAISDGSRTLAMSAAVYPREGDVKELGPVLTQVVEKRAAAVRTLRRLRDEAMHSGSPDGGVQ